MGRFVEYFGPGLSSLTLPDRATLANMGPEYGATIGFFPVDDVNLGFLASTGRSPGAGGAGGEGKQGDGALPDRRHSGSGLHLGPGAGHVHHRAQRGRPQEAPGPYPSDGPENRLRAGSSQAGSLGILPRRRWWRRAGPAGTRRSVDRSTLDGGAVDGGGREHRHRRHYLLHQHLQSFRHGGCRPPGQEGRGTGPGGEALGQDESGPGVPGGDGLPRRLPVSFPTWKSSSSRWWATAARPASETRALFRTPSRTPSRTTAWW